MSRHESDSPTSPLRIHHLGYAVRDLERSRERFTELGFVEETAVFDDKLRKVDIIFMVKDGYRIELVCPNAEGSVMKNLLDKVGDTPYHICYETVDLDHEIRILERKSYLVADPPKPAVALRDQRVAFLYRPGVGLIELLETDEK
jgi:catechol 2,3-dioxygenase-like lactoylglutathione lyase family enzyme